MKKSSAQNRAEGAQNEQCWNFRSDSRLGVDWLGHVATALKQEPPMGAMREGEVVLVDDGSCPKGQIKRVVGGNYVKVGGTKNIVRTRSCVAR